MGIRTPSKICPCAMSLVQTLVLFVVATTSLIGHSEASFPFPGSNACTSSHAPAATTAPPPLPPLPKQYSMRVEANIMQKSWTTEIEEHYDSVNKRASVARTFNGTRTVSIFDFDNGKRYDMYQDGTCKTRNAGIDYTGFVSMGKQHKPALATINEVFRFGTGFQQTYVGKDNIRGIQVNHWTSCQEWESLGAKFQLDYYFSDPDFITASSTEQIPVRAVINGTANNVGMLSSAMSGTHTFQHVYEFASVRTGPVFNEEVFHIPAGIFCKDMDTDKPQPELPDTFEMSMEVIIPGSMVHPMQKFLRYDYEDRLVETWMRMVVPQQFDFNAAHGGGRGPGGSGRPPSGGPRGGPSQESVDLDSLKLMTMSKVEDFSTGIIYLNNKMNNTCKATKMSPDMKKIGMAHGQNLLFVADSQKNQPEPFSYQGLTTFRHMTVDVWATEKNGVTQEMYFLPPGAKNHGRHGFSHHGMTTTPPAPQATKSVSPYPTLVGLFMKNQSAIHGNSLSAIFRDIMSSDTMQWGAMAEAWRANQNGGNSSSSANPGATPRPQQPVRPMGPPRMSGDQMAWGVQLEKMMDQRLSEKIINVFHYSPMLTDSTNFQVSACYPESERSQVMLVVNTPYETSVLHSFAAFSNSIRRALAERVGVSVLQISNLVPTPLKAAGFDATTVTFTLLGATPIEGESTITDGSNSQINVMDGKKKLVNAIHRGVTFSVQYGALSRQFIVEKKLYTIDYDRYQLPANTATGTGKTWNPDVKPDSKPLAQTQKESNSDGYSPSSVAGIAIGTFIFGAVVCLVVVFFMYRRRHPGESVIPYRLTT